MKILLFGANNPHTAKVLSDLASQQSEEIVGFLDSDPKKEGLEFCGLPIFGGFDYLDKLDRGVFQVVNLITRDCDTRAAVTQQVEQLGFTLTNLIHPTVNTNFVTLGRGLYIQEYVTLQGGSKISNNVSIHVGATIAHESVIGESSFVAHGALISGLVTVGSCVFVGAGAIILPRVQVGDNCVIGAGAVVLRDVPASQTVVGNPARTITSDRTAL